MPPTVYVCICHAVTDVEVEQAVEAGADTIEAVGERTSAGRSCATCHDHLADILEAGAGRVGCPLAAMRVA